MLHLPKCVAAPRTMCYCCSKCHHSATALAVTQQAPLKLLVACRIANGMADNAIAGSYKTSVALMTDYCSKYKANEVPDP
jgi:hypothetical protein